MKLIIQIPCFNEEDQLPTTLGDLPRRINGFDAVEWLVVDDGSTDRTIEVARAHGVDHIVRLTNNKGLATAFQAGLDACLKLGADVVVNTDADNQYDGRDIPRLVEPILEGRADMVVGDRGVESVEHFSPLYERLKVFMTAAAVVGLAAFVIWARFLWFFIDGSGKGHIQSLILGAVLFIVAVQLAALGVVGDVLAGSRVLQQRILERVRRVELQLGVEPSHYEPGDAAAGRPPTTGAEAGRATGSTEEREALKL